MPNRSDLAKLTYLSCVIKEAVRLHAVSLCTTLRLSSSSNLRLIQTKPARTLAKPLLCMSSLAESLQLWDVNAGSRKLALLHVYMNLALSSGQTHTLHYSAAHFNKPRQNNLLYNTTKHTNLHVVCVVECDDGLPSCLDNFALSFGVFSFRSISFTAINRCTKLSHSQ